MQSGRILIHIQKLFVIEIQMSLTWLHMDHVPDHLESESSFLGQASISYGIAHSVPVEEALERVSFIDGSRTGTRGARAAGRPLSGCLKMERVTRLSAIQDHCDTERDEQVSCETRMK